MIRLLQGDCLAAMDEIPTGSVDLVACDLPYGRTECGWDAVVPFAPLWGHLLRVIRPRGAIVLTAMQPFTTDLIVSNRAWFRYALVWEKSRATGHLDANRRPMRAHEDVLVFAAGNTTYNPQFGAGLPYRSAAGARRGTETLGDKRAARVKLAIDNDGRRFPRSVLRFDSVAPRECSHPTQKPLPLMEWIVRTYSHPGETVLDCTMGSGTTAVACIRSGRRFVGVERSPRFHAVASRRVAEALASAGEAA